MPPKDPDQTLRRLKFVRETLKIVADEIANSDIKIYAELILAGKHVGAAITRLQAQVEQSCVPTAEFSEYYLTEQGKAQTASQPE